MKKLVLIFVVMLSALISEAQNCNLVNVTWAHTPQPGDPYNVTFTDATPTTTPGNYVVSVISYNPMFYGLVNGSYSYSFPNSGTYSVATLLDIVDPATGFYICHDSVNILVTIPPNPLCAATLSSVNNGGGSYTFTATPVGSATGLTYSWNFGDGSATATGASATHSYANSGSYNVTLTTTAGGVICTETTTINYFSGSLNCANLYASLGYSNLGTTANFVDYSTVVNIPGAPIGMTYAWDFGDGGTSTSQNSTHTYASLGSYNVSLITNWINTSTQAVLCADTATTSITLVNNTPDYIEGSVTWASGLGVPTTSFKVWLITYDATTNIISAIDSTITQGASWGNWFAFVNVPAGDYRLKAAVLSTMPGTSVMAPTYHSASTYWGTANVINYTGGISTGNTITMQGGSSTSGPGFIAGNVTQGAGKGTGAGVPDLLVLLRDDNNQMVKFTYTDANGDYSFDDLPLGTYNIYPENMPQVTTPSSDMNITATNTSIAGVDFEKKSATIKPKTTSVPDAGMVNRFMIFPNPAKDAVTLRWVNHVTEEVDVVVTDMTGREVLTHHANTNDAVQLNLAHVSAGVYFIKVAGEKTQQTQKVVVQ